MCARGTGQRVSKGTTSSCASSRRYRTERSSLCVSWDKVQKVGTADGEAEPNCVECASQAKALEVPFRAIRKYVSGDKSRLCVNYFFFAFFFNLTYGRM